MCIGTVNPYMKSWPYMYAGLVFMVAFLLLVTLPTTRKSTLLFVKMNKIIYFLVSIAFLGKGLFEYLVPIKGC
jgi:hypothetical protein